MPSLNEIRRANTVIRKSHDASTAVFVGATHGIGLATLRAFVTYVPHPTAIVIGRSESKFRPDLERIRALNADARITFLETDVSLLKNIDAVCIRIREELKGRTIDILFEGQGYLNLGAQKLNADGIEESFSLRYYGRVLFAQNLLSSMSPTARVVNVLAAGTEGKMVEDDLGLKTHWGFSISLVQLPTLTTLAFDHLAAANPSRAFIHVNPGVVNTGMLSRSNKGLMHVATKTVETVAALFSRTPEEAGERMVHYATSERFQKGSVMVTSTSELAKEVEQLKVYRRTGFAEKVWAHTEEVLQNTRAKGQ